MKFYAISDLHLDFYSIRRDFWYDFDREAVLLIAGDVANGLAGINYVTNILCNHFSAVVMVAGNHEWYTHKKIVHQVMPYSFSRIPIHNPDYSTVQSYSPIVRLKKHAKRVSNLFYLDNEPLAIDGVIIYGGTLWFPIHTYSIDLLERYSQLMNDSIYLNYKIIEEQHKAFIANFPTTVDIVISHHLPCEEAFARKEDLNSELSPFYHASLSKELVAKAKFWICGHQHLWTEKYIANGKTNLICNPKGITPLKPNALSNKLFSVE